MIAGHDRRSQCRPGVGGAGIEDDLRPENRQYLQCAKEHADETFSLTQLDPAEYTCLVYLSVLLCALAKKHNRKLRSTRKPTCAHRRKSILVANESCIFPFKMLGNRQLSHKNRVFDRYSPPVLRASRVPRARTCCYRRRATWSPFCFDVSLPSLQSVQWRLGVRTNIYNN